MWFIKLYQSLEILTHCEMPYPSGWNCSWVPNLSSPKLAQSITFGNASGQAQAKYQVTAQNKLLVEGVHVASVSRVSAPVPKNATIKELLWIVRGWVFEYLLDESSHVAPEKSRAFVSTLLTREYTVEDVDGDSTIVNGMNSDSFTVFTFTDLDRTSEKDLLELRFVKSVRQTLPGRALFRTSEGFYRLGPAAMGLGDHICVLLRCNTPMILRLSWHQLDCHLVVGQCFVIKLIDKEALLGPLQSPDISALTRWISVRNGRLIVMYLGDGIAIEEDPRLSASPPSWEIYEETITSPPFKDHQSSADM